MVVACEALWAFIGALMIDLSSFKVILFVYYCINSKVLSFRDICGHHHCDRVVNQYLHLDHRSDLPQVWFNPHHTFMCHVLLFVKLFHVEKDSSLA